MRPLILMPTISINSRNSNACYLQLLSVHRDASTPHRQSSAARGAAAPVRRGRVHIAIGAQERAACIGGPQHTVKARAPAGRAKGARAQGADVAGRRSFCTFGGSTSHTCHKDHGCVNSLDIYLISFLSSLSPSLSYSVKAWGCVDRSRWAQKAASRTT